MKYMCEICGCTMPELEKMLEHEKLCREQNDRLLYCTEQINTLVGSAEVSQFGVVVELYGEDKKPVYYRVKGAEADAAKRRCKITLVYENGNKEKQAAQNQGADKK